MTKGLDCRKEMRKKFSSLELSHSLVIRASSLGIKRPQPQKRPLPGKKPDSGRRVLWFVRSFVRRDAVEGGWRVLLLRVFAEDAHAVGADAFLLGLKLFQGVGMDADLGFLMDVEARARGDQVA